MENGNNNSEGSSTAKEGKIVANSKDPFHRMTELCRESPSSIKKSPDTYFGQPGDDDFSVDSESDSVDAAPHPHITIMSPPDSQSTNDGGTGVQDKNIRICPEPISINADRVGADDGRRGTNLHGMNQRRRVLPSWANERERAHAQPNLNEGFGGIPLLDLLKSLEMESEKDRELQDLSLLEVAERRWGTLFKCKQKD